MVRWNITQENISLLDDIRNIEAGTLELYCYNVESDDFKRVIRFMKEHGPLLHTCILHPHAFSKEIADLEHVDFATHCPHLQTLDIKRITFNQSVFAHPTLEILRLWGSDYRGPQTVTIGNGLSKRDGRQLKEVGFLDCRISTDTLTIGPAAQLKVFQYFLDEDAVEQWPDTFVFNACPQLEEITIHASATWNIFVKGILPQCKRISLDTRGWGSYRFEIEDADDHHRMMYRRLEQDGRDDEEESDDEEE
ncbi:hypothetical protein KSD_17570 [Ktedonobacter sp. SOSP1-85]|uniref:hypothetical protein n=1 Tax=Ktedonobacter sp. SOSP1-85 TaxID=2778367 RepID=UPI001915E737|nr:hypothetical protein [Ktedonobacter sp. SOSP1-85]GHO73986.1 hypothetical protein KSD_17570 [Ktedonobacter sp. SOSP1-85]